MTVIVQSDIALGGGNDGRVHLSLVGWSTSNHTAPDYGSMGMRVIGSSTTFLKLVVSESAT